MIAKNKRIVITGIGPLTSIGIGKDAVWAAIRKSKTGLAHKDYYIEGEKIDGLYVHAIKNFTLANFGIEESVLFDIEAWKEKKDWPDLSYLLAAVKLALDDSKLKYDRDTNNVGLILTHENPGLDQFYMEVFQSLKYFSSKSDPGGTVKSRFRKFFDGFKKEAYDLQTFMFVYHVAKAFSLHGYSLFLNNACASGLYALEAAADILRSGKCSAVIVAAADQVSVFKQFWFRELEMYPKDGKIKPFAKNRDGFVLGDGAAGLVLETLESARKRKAPVYAEYCGGGFSLEGWKVATPNLMSDSYTNAINEALVRSRIKKKEIDLIVPHGVGTTVTDSYEARAITSIFGAHFKRPLITAFKPYIGHTLGANALIETAIILLALKNRVIPPVLNSKTVDPKLNINVVQKKTATRFKTVLKTSCGFAGYNAAAIFRKI